MISKSEEQSCLSFLRRWDGSPRFAKQILRSEATNKPQCHAGTRVPVWAGGVKLERQPKTCEARIANMRSMIGTSPRFAKANPRLERQKNEHTTIINFQFKEE